MSKRSIMSNQLKEEIAKELGVYETVKQNGGWGDVTSRDCGNMVTKAIEMAEKDDVIVIAGKGHETYQILKDKTIHFDEREVVKEILDSNY